MWVWLKGGGADFAKSVPHFANPYLLPKLDDSTSESFDTHEHETVGD